MTTRESLQPVRYPTQESIGALLRRAGFDRSKGPSLQPTPGYAVSRSSQETVIVYYRSKPRDPAAEHEALDSYAEAIRAAGWSAEIDARRGDVIVTAAPAPRGVVMTSQAEILMNVPGEREGRLPAWTQELLSRLRKELRDATADADRLEQENDRLRAVVEGKAEAGSGDSDTFLVNEDTAAELGLGSGPEIRFADFYTVRYGAHDETGTARALIIETDQRMQIRPTMDRDVIIIARA